MKPVKFNEVNVTYAENQPEYIPLPVYKEEDGMVTSCWKLSWKERIKILFTGKLWLQMLTFNTPLQPVKLNVDNPISEGR